MADNFTRFTGDWHFASSTSFFTEGDQRDVFVAGTRLRFHQFVSEVDTEKFAVVSSTAYSNSRTTVTVDSESDTIINSKIFSPCYTYDFLISDATPTFVPDVITAQIDDASITTAKINDEAVTAGKLAPTLDLSSKSVTLASNEVSAGELAATLDLSGKSVTLASGEVSASELASALDLTAKDVKLSVKSGTPVNAVAASKQLTFGGNVTDNDTLTLDGQVYTFQSAIGAGVAASGTLTVADTPHEGDQITIGAKTYKFRAAIGAGTAASKALDFTDVPLNTETVVIDGTTYTFVTALTEAKATGTLTATANPQDGARVTIGSTVYTFRDTLDTAFDVKIGAAATNSLDNLIAAINLDAGEGTLYGTSTTVHPTVTAAAGAGDTMDVTAKTIGVAGNAVTTVEYSPGLSWGDGTMTGGVNAVTNEVVIGTVEGSIDNAVAAAMGTAGEGTTYSTGTTHLANVTIVKTDADTITATANSVGFAGNSIAIGETLTNAAWAGGATALSGGVDAQAANDVLIGANAEAAIDNLVLAITDGGVEGTNYGTGTTASTEVTAVKATAATMTATASTTGEAGESIATTDPIDGGGHLSWASATLTGGEGAQAANDVLIGVSAEATLNNLVDAVNAATGAGTTCGNGTVAHTTITATKDDASHVTFSAKTKGTAGNSIAIAENSSQLSFAGGATALSGGVNGTVGAAREVYADTSYLYITTAANTVADVNWRRISLGSAY